MHEEEVLGKAYDARLMKRLLGYLRPYRALVAMAFAGILAHSALQAVGPYLTKLVIDRYMSNLALPAAERFQGVTFIALLYLASLAATFAVDFLQTWSMQMTGQKVMFDLRMQIFEHLQKLHVAFFDRNPVGRLVTRLTSDVDALNEMFTAGVIAIFGDFFTLAVIVIVMLSMDARLALISFAVLPLIALATALFRARVRDSYRRIRTAVARINAYLQEHITGMAVLQLFNREEKSFEEFDQVNRRHLVAFKDSVFAHALFYPTVEILSAVAISLILWHGGVRALDGGVTLGVVVAFIQYAQRFYRPIQDLSEKYNVLQGAMASAERVFKLLDTPAAIASPAKPVKPAETPGRIEFRGIWFSYKGTGAAPEAAQPATAVSPGDGHPDGRVQLSGDGLPRQLEEPEWVLKDVSFTVRPGETVAIVGHTGAGKTTIINLLLRFYDVQRGQILVDGVDIRDYDLAELRRMFGVALQDPFLFSGTVERNIRLGSAHVGVADMEQAAEEVNIADFIRSLPEGFGAEVRERGATLSTGQKQLMSFARALAHRPRILVLDEATSSVDTETEFRVRDALARMVRGRTSIVIAHRLSTIQSAGRILVMHKGRLRESGTHQELLAARGIYWKLYQLQYRDQEVAT